MTLMEGIMKRIGLVLGFVTLIAVSAFSSTAVGVYGNYIGGGSQYAEGLGLTLKFNNFPVIGAEWYLGQTASFNVSVDWWAINAHLGGSLDYYLGVGAFAGIGNQGFDIGGRIPIGLQIFPVERFEIFGEIAPLVYFLPTLSLGFNLRVGIRVHF